MCRSSSVTTRTVSPQATLRSQRGATKASQLSRLIALKYLFRRRTSSMIWTALLQDSQTQSASESKMSRQGILIVTLAILAQTKLVRSYWTATTSLLTNRANTAPIVLKTTIPWETQACLPRESLCRVENCILFKRSRTKKRPVTYSNRRTSLRQKRRRSELTIIDVYSIPTLDIQRKLWQLSYAFHYYPCIKSLMLD